MVNKLSRLHGMDVVHTFADIPACVFQGASVSARFKGPKEFISYIRDASLVITRSYHAAIFAILFQRPLYAYVDNKTGTRFESLLRELGMDDRLVHGYIEPHDVDLAYDYHGANRRLERFREDSISYLRRALGACGL